VGRPKDDVGKQRLPQSDQATADVTVASTATSPRLKRFIVQLKTPSAAALVGRIIVPAAATAAGEDAESSSSNPSVAAHSTRVDQITPASAAAASAIHTEAAAVAAAAGVTTQVTHRYSYALSGFAVEAPSAAQLAALAADPAVLSVSEDRMVSLRTFSTPQFLGLKQSVWNEVRPRHDGSWRRHNNLYLHMLQDYCFVKLHAWASLSDELHSASVVNLVAATAMMSRLQQARGPWDKSDGATVQGGVLISTFFPFAAAAWRSGGVQRCWRERHHWSH
jgi:hypothetical protein